MFKNRSFLLLCAVGVSMGALAAYAAIPGAFVPASLAQAGFDAPAGAPRGLKATLQAADADGPPPEAAASAPMQVAQISPLAPSFNPIAYGEGETGTGLVLNGKPSPIHDEAGTSLPPSTLAGGLQKAMTFADADDQECLYDARGRRQGVPLEKLVLIIQSAIAAVGPTSQVDDFRTVIQSDLNRSGDTQKVKGAALQQLMGLYATTTVAGRALRQPFDLQDIGFTEASGYDPCANPAATGPSGFGRGPFADTFSTINPMPVVAARALAVTEGGGV